MSTFKKFEEIVSWQKARELNKGLGKHIDGGRFNKSYKLINQIEGSAGSIMDNIAEGFERGGNREFIQFHYISKGSCGEFRSQLYRLRTEVTCFKMNLMNYTEWQWKQLCFYKS